MLSIASATKTILDLVDDTSILQDRIRVPSGAYQNDPAGTEIEKAIDKAIDKKLKNKYLVNIELQSTESNERFSFTIYYNKNGLSGKTTDGYIFKNGKVTFEAFDSSILYPKPGT